MVDILATSSISLPPQHIPAMVALTHKWQSRTLIKFVKVDCRPRETQLDQEFKIE